MAGLNTVPYTKGFKHHWNQLRAQSEHAQGFAITKDYRKTKGAEGLSAATPKESLSDELITLILKKSYSTTQTEQEQGLLKSDGKNQHR